MGSIVSQRVSNKCLCGQSSRESGVTEAPEVAIAAVLWRWRATLDTLFVAGRRPEWTFWTPSQSGWVRRDEWWVSGRLWVVLLSVFLAPEAALLQAIRTNAYQATWVRPHTNRLLFEAGVSHQPVSFRMGWTAGADPDIPGILDAPDLVASRNGGGIFGWTHRHRYYQLRLA